MILCRRRLTWVKVQVHPVVPHRLWMKKLTQIRDELAAVGSKTEDEELVQIALSGFSLSHGTPL